MAQFDPLADKEKMVTTPPEEIFRATYRRRGSEIYICATKDAKVLVTRFKTRANSYEHWVYDHQVIEANAEGLKEWLEAETYKKVSAAPTGSTETPA